MIISEPDPKIKTVEDIDFIFVGGVIRSVTLDREAGDSYDITSHKDGIIITIAEAVSLDGSTKIPEETVTIFKNNLLYTQRKLREVTELTTSQREEWHKTFQEMGTKTIQ